MKKVTVITILSWLMGVGFANAQTTTFTGKLLNSDRTRAFIVTSTTERERLDGSRFFKTETIKVGGGSSHFDITIDDATGSPTSIDIYGYTTMDTIPSLQHVISCLGEDLVAVSTKPAGSTYPQKQTIKAIALCAFNPNGVGVGTDGRAYLVINGTETDTAENTPVKFVLSGTIAGGFNSEADNFVFKGPFGTVLTEQLTD